MGMFDRVMVSCPNCHEKKELQSKAGKCNLTTYSPRNAPLEILADVSREAIVCNKCGTVFRIRVQHIVTTEIADLDDEDEYEDY